jgi:hypothetical protein
LTPLGRNLVHTIIAAGALDILKAALDTSEEIQEKAYDQAVEIVVDSYGIKDKLVEDNITEFIDALGWEISAATPVTELERLPSKPEMPVRFAYAGQRNAAFGKYKWRVLDVKDGKALLLSEDILEKRAYHHESVSITWEKCDLRSYLNREFLRTFKEEEQKQIATVTNINEDNQWYKTVGGNDTNDKVFLLSLTEVVKYFGDSGILQNPSKEEKENWYVHDRYSDSRKTKYGNEWYWWWLRSPGSGSHGAVGVLDDGDLGLSGSRIGSGGGGVRPALWLNL